MSILTNSTLTCESSLSLAPEEALCKTIHEPPANDLDAALMDETIAATRIDIFCSSHSIILGGGRHFAYAWGGIWQTLGAGLLRCCGESGRQIMREKQGAQ
ncbi:hypothetical protein FGO68_gene12752 [Halteria grandinella]|uniref:Uncharacterized protein n=1 Tax=Halteria grandinella TaxID=5974 RepID=A0A8J8SYG7_HALGN|nr:hypothetical protein FGO68_gene12752 [Halteria grandinella]